MGCSNYCGLGKFSVSSARAKERWPLCGESATEAPARPLNRQFRIRESLLIQENARHLKDFGKKNGSAALLPLGANMTSAAGAFTIFRGWNKTDVPRPRCANAQWREVISVFGVVFSTWYFRDFGFTYLQLCNSTLRLQTAARSRLLEAA